MRWEAWVLIGWFVLNWFCAVALLGREVTYTKSVVVLDSIIYPFLIWCVLRCVGVIS